MKTWRDKILWKAALRLVKKYNPIVIAIGGAIAKTSTKEAVGAVMEAKFMGEVKVAYGNLNTYLGVPLAILGYKIDFYEQKISWQWPFILIGAVIRSHRMRLPKYLVLEYGTDQPGDVPALVAKITPKIALLTIAGPAHLANYESETAIVEEEGDLVAHLPTDGLAILNKQDPYFQVHRSKTTAPVIEVDCSLENIAVEYAKALGHYFSLSDEEIEHALNNKTQPPHRFNLCHYNTWQVLDDSYNANPLSMKAALNILRSSDTRRRVAILGEMRELGLEEKHMHQEVGAIARKSADLIIGIGPLAKEYQPDHWFSTSSEAAKNIVALLQEEDTILVKGSHAVNMHVIIDELCKEHI